MRNVKAPGYNVLVKLKRIKSDSGLIIPDRVQKAIEEAYVIDIGPDAFKFKDIECSGPWCEKNDCVAIIKYAGKELEGIEAEETYRMIRDTDIVAVFPDERVEA